MAFDVSAVRRRLILDEERELARLQESEAQLQRTLNDALYAFEQARQGVEEVQLAMHDVQTRRILSTNRLLLMRQAAASALMLRMPAELLRAVFEALLPDCPSYTPTLALRNEPPVLARDIFSVAAVCSRWRSIALSYPRLWSFVHLGGSAPGRFHPEVVNILLQRSGNLPLCISFHWPIIAHWIHQSHIDSERILNALIQNAERWKYFEGVFETSTPTGLSSAWKVFAPNLEYFSLKMAYDGIIHDRDITHPMVPVAPQLKTLDYLGPKGLHMNPIGLAPAALSTLRLRPGHLRAWDLVQATMRTLEVLHVHMWTFQEFHPVSDLDMPRLHTLIFATNEDRAIPLLNAMHTPQLRHLRISADLLKPGVQTFCHQAASTVETVHTWGRTTAMALPILQILRNLERLTFGHDLGEIHDAYSVTGNFFVQMTKTTECVLPKLQYLVFTSAGQFDIPELTDGFLKFLRSRNSATAPRPHGPCRIQEVVMNAKKVPVWFPAEVKRLVEG